MNDTIDLTTPQGLYAEQRRLAAKIGTRDPWVAFGVDASGALIHLAPSFTGEDRRALAAARGPTFAEAIAEADRRIDAWKIKRRETIVRKLALAIIETTDEHTHCTVTLLRAKGFAEADIFQFHEAACARASEMAGLAPFVVEGV